MIYFAFIAINISWEKDFYDDAVYKPEKSTIKEVKFDELFKDSKFKNLLQNVSNNSNMARSAFENQNGFTISNTNVKVIQTDSVTSYTMLIQRDSVFNSSYFENLVIQEDIFNNQKAFIIKYTPNQITSTVDNSFAFQGKIKKSQIAFTGFNRSGSYQNTTQADCYIEVLMCSYGEDHVAGQGCVDKPNPTLYLKKIAVLCQDNGGGSGGSGDISIGDPFNGGGGSSGSDGDDLGDPFSGGSSSGGSGNGSTNTNNDGFDSEVVTSPISNQDIINTYLFYNSLSPNQQSWANENVDAYNQLIQYQIDNNWSDESETFVEELMDLELNGNLLSFFPSFKYPAGSNYSTLYPNFTILVKKYIPLLKNDQRLLNTINRLTGVSISTIKQDLTWGNGPEINITQLGLDLSGNPYYGKFNILEPNKFI